MKIQKDPYLGQHKMFIEKLHTPELVAEECVVVIDVLRAFTTAAYAFSVGASKIIPVGTLDEAFALREQYKNCFLMGEIDGYPIKGFDFGNSPTEIKKLDLTGCTLIQRTSSGTQGVVRSMTSQKILVASFVVAESTLKRVLSIAPQKLTFVITGKSNGDEDLALADYLQEKIQYKKKIDSSPFLQRVVDSPDGQYYALNNKSHLQADDLKNALAIDKFDFAMQVVKNNNRLIIYPVNEFGITLCSTRKDYTKAIAKPVEAHAKRIQN